MAVKIRKTIRQTDGRAVEDPSSITNLTYNEASGAQKNLAAGHCLKPLDVAGGGYTTDATTARSVRKGTTLAIYNNSGSVGSITISDLITTPSLAAGATDVNGNVGLACRPNDWTYFNTYKKNFVIASAATLLVYVVEDESYVSNQSQG